MKTGWKIAIYALICVAMIAAGVILGRAIQDDPQEQDLIFTLMVSAPGNFTLDMTPKNQAGEPEIDVARGTPAVFTITASAHDGYDALVTYSITGIPEGSYAFSQNPAPCGVPVTLTIQTGSLTSNTVYVCTLTGSPS